MPKLNVLIAGSTGYIGIQLVKLLLKHPNINIKYLCGNTSKGKSITYFDKSIKNKKLPKIIKFSENLLNDIDIVFTALPNGQSQKISNKLLKKNILIDLSADFRLKSAKEYLKWYKIKHNSKNNIKNSIYALPEISKKKLKNYKIISCPGCYPTSVLLPLIPLVKNNLIETSNIIIDSKSGYSGAGKNFERKFKHKNILTSIYSYKVNGHRHMSELNQEFKKNSSAKIKYSFNPHLIPTFRGLISSIYLELNNTSISKVHYELKRFHKKNKFVKILKLNSELGTGNVLNTNKCEISVCESNINNRIVIFSAIDNLIKGASGQAVQNMNLSFGFNESSGLI